MKILGVFAEAALPQSPALHDPDAEVVDQSIDDGGEGADSSDTLPWPDDLVFASAPWHRASHLKLAIPLVLH